MIFFERTQLAGDIIRQIKANTVIDDQALSKDELEGLLDLAYIFKSPLPKDSYLVKVARPIYTTKSSKFLLSKDPPADNGAAYKLIPIADAQYPMRFNIGDCFFQSKLIGNFFIFNVENRSDGLNYWINYPKLPASNCNRRLKEEKLAEICNHKIELKVGTIIKNYDDDDYMIKAIDGTSPNWKKKDVIIQNVKNYAEQEIKLSKEKVLSDYEVMTFEQSLSMSLQEIHIDGNFN